MEIPGRTILKKGGIVKKRRTRKGGRKYQLNKISYLYKNAGEFDPSIFDQVEKHKQTPVSLKVAPPPLPASVDSAIRDIITPVSEVIKRIKSLSLDPVKIERRPEVSGISVAEKLKQLGLQKPKRGPTVLKTEVIRRKYKIVKLPGLRIKLVQVDRMLQRQRNLAALHEPSLQPVVVLEPLQPLKNKKKSIILKAKRRHITLTDKDA